MVPSIHLTHATLNDAAFALLEQYVNGEITDTAALTKIDVKLDVAGIPFDQEEWLDLIKVILMSPTEGLNSIKAAQQLTQAKVVPLLEDAAAWQLVLWWVGDDSFSFNSFLQEMQDRFKERYKFDDWKTIFNQVFKASHEGTAVELVRAAMSECGVLNPPSVPNLSLSQALSSGDLVDNASRTIPSTQASSSQTRKVSHKSNSSLPPAKHARLSKSMARYLDVSAWEDEDDENEDGDQDNLDIRVENCPKVMEHYVHEGGVIGSNAQAHQNWVPNVESCPLLEVPEIFLASHVSLMTYTSQDPHDQLFHDPLANESCIQLGDLVQVVSGPHKGLSGTLHYHSSCEILITLSTLPQESTDDPGNKGKSKAQESEVASGDGGINENSDLIQVSVSIDDAIIIPPSTLQLLKERGYDVSISNCVWVAHGPAVGAEGPVHAVNFASGHLTVLSEDGPWHDVPISFCVKVEDYTLRDQEHHVSREVWIISGPSKGYRGMLRSVGRTFRMVRIHLGIMQLKNTAVVTESGMLLNGTPLDSTRMAVFIALCQNLFAEIAPPPHCATPPLSLSAVDPLAKPGPSTSTSNPWIVNTDNVTMPCPNETEKQQIDYGM
ncbi:hypothetical protein PISMIDRAFT_19130 [Pisolithus microcarpus 441]|uniref:Uncharacterized protein n=1 Tax=Pisolithus microcarpus 441 TaxID=765257 RepID=A0A0C9XHX7_9AGAM|nr:hypothetical protein BKA83DRAFT_19130 [Pisolithus microcarpus]KIK11915.1 hypothetical protein PISMIDRAFT_19130 [Pisolithus microcarpus 441]